MEEYLLINSHEGLGVSTSLYENKMKGRVKHGV